MGIEDRDWYQRDAKPTRGRTNGISGWVIVAGIVVGLIVAGVAKRQLQGPSATYGVEKKTHSPGTRISLMPGAPEITIGGDSLYAKDDPWMTYLADEQTCPGGERSDTPLTTQAAAMVCLVNYARKQRGLRPLAPLTLLNSTSTWAHPASPCTGGSTPRGTARTSFVPSGARRE